LKILQERKYTCREKKTTHESLPIFLFRISNPKEWKMRLLWSLYIYEKE